MSSASTLLAALYWKLSGGQLLCDWVGDWQVVFISCGSMTSQHWLLFMIVHCLPTLVSAHQHVTVLFSLVYFSSYRPTSKPVKDGGPNCRWRPSSTDNPCLTH